jgi:hypothetical protein
MAVSNAYTFDFATAVSMLQPAWLLTVIYNVPSRLDNITVDREMGLRQYEMDREEWEIARQLAQSIYHDITLLLGLSACPHALSRTRVLLFVAEAPRWLRVGQAGVLSPPWVLRVLLLLWPSLLTSAEPKAPTPTVPVAYRSRGSQWHRIKHHTGSSDVTYCTVIT